jgi:hypothetical protein
MGYAVYFLIFEVIYILMKVLIKCEILGLHDWSFLLDDSDNHHMIVAVGVFEKFDFVTMKMYLTQKTKIIDKC